MRKIQLKWPVDVLCSGSIPYAYSHISEPPTGEHFQNKEAVFEQGQIRDSLC